MCWGSGSFSNSVTQSFTAKRSKDLVRWQGGRDGSPSRAPLLLQSGWGELAGQVRWTAQL